jgi:hypothetical protein
MRNTTMLSPFLCHRTTREARLFAKRHLPFAVMSLPFAMMAHPLHRLAGEGRAAGVGTQAIVV